MQPTDEQVRVVCGADGGWWCERVYRWTDNEPLAQAATWIVEVPVRILIIIVVAWVLHRLVRRAIAKLSERLGGLRSRAPERLAAAIDPRSEARAQTISTVLRGLASALIATIAVITILGELGIAIGPLVAGAGIAGVALGFGAQSLVKDFLSGMFMILEDQFGVGDVIDVGEVSGPGISGVVESVSLRATRLRSVDGTVWHVPNGEIRRVGNKSQQWSRALLDITVAYGTDVERASEVIQRTAEAVAIEPEWAERVLETPSVWGVEGVGAEGVTIRLVVKTTPGDQWELMRHLRVRIKAALDGAGIDVPPALWVRPTP